MPCTQLSPAPRMAGSARATRWRCGGHRGASASTSTRRSTWRISMVEAKDRCDASTIAHCSRSWRPQQSTRIRPLTRQWLERRKGHREVISAGLPIFNSMVCIQTISSKCHKYYLNVRGLHMPHKAPGKHPRKGISFTNLIRIFWHSNRLRLYKTRTVDRLVWALSYEAYPTGKPPSLLETRQPDNQRKSRSKTAIVPTGGVEERRGGLGPMGITPFPLPAHQNVRISRKASPQSTRRWAKMDPTLSDHTELPEHDRIGETWCHATTPYGACMVTNSQEMTYSLVRSSSLIPDNQFGSPAPPSP